MGIVDRFLYTTIFIKQSTHRKNIKNYTKILIAIFIGTLFYSLSSTTFLDVQSRLIGVVAFLVVLWSNEGLPLGVVSLMPIILFPMLGILDTNDVSGNYSKSIIFLFIGGFLLAIAVEKIGLHKVIANKILSVFPPTPIGIIYSLAITSAILSAFLSNTTTALLLVSVAIFLTDNIKLKARFVLAVAYGASIGGVMTPIGTPPNLILMGFLEEISIEPMSFFTWGVMTIPLALSMILVMGYVLSIGTKNIEITQNDEVISVDNNQKKLLYILASLGILLVINSPIKPFYDGLGLNEKGILLGYGLLMFMPFINFLKWSDSKKIPFEIIFLFGAGFSIAKAFGQTGLAVEIANILSSFAHLNTYILILIVASFVTFTTEITSNTALISMALPIIYALTQEAGLNTELFLMVATICASYAFMLPIATPPNAIAMGSGVIKIKQMASVGFVFNIVGILLIFIIASFYWTLFL